MIFIIMIFFFLALLKFGQSGGLTEYPSERMFCYTALVLALETRNFELIHYDEATAHEIANSMRMQRKHLGMGLQRLAWISEDRYVKYLGRMRAEVLRREIMENFVRNLTAVPVYVREYVPNITEVDVLHYKPVAKLLRSLSFSLEHGDNVRLEYYRNALAALRIFSSVHYDYLGFARFPDISKPLSLKQLEHFIGKNFVRFDFGSTYPDIVMCLSLLQYLKYVALLDANLDLVSDILQLHKKAVEAMAKMNIAPVNRFDFNAPKGLLTVYILPQVSKGPIMVPICTLPYSKGTIVQISVLDVKYPMDRDYVLAQMKNLKLCH